MDQFDKDLKSEFQLERIIFFSDAVFAIAITLLIIDIRIPFRNGYTDGQLLHAIGEKWPELFGFAISFFIIASFWIHHHKMFGYVLRFDSKLMWLNLFFLFFIVLLPFSTSVFGLYGNLLTATSLYTLNILLAGIMIFLCFRYIADPRKKLSAGLELPEKRRLLYARTLAIPVWILICWIIGWITVPGIGDFFLFGLSFVMPLTKLIFGKKQKSEQKPATVEK